MFNFTQETLAIPAPTVRDNKFLINMQHVADTCTIKTNFLANQYFWYEFMVISFYSLVYFLLITIKKMCQRPKAVVCLWITTTPILSWWMMVQRENLVGRSSSEQCLKDTCLRKWRLGWQKLKVSRSYGEWKKNNRNNLFIFGKKDQNWQKLLLYMEQGSESICL